MYFRENLMAMEEASISQGYPYEMWRWGNLLS